MLDAALADLANPPQQRRAAGAGRGARRRRRPRPAVRAHRRRHGRSRRCRRPPAARRRRSRAAWSRRRNCAAFASPAKRFRALKSFLAIHVPLDRAAAALKAFARSAGLSLGSALANFSARVEAVEAQGLPPAAIRYDAAFGRPLDYYTGLVFEISAGADSPKPRRGLWPAAAATTGCSPCSAQRRRSPASASRSGSTASRR